MIRIRGCSCHERLHLENTRQPSHFKAHMDREQLLEDTIDVFARLQDAARLQQQGSRRRSNSNASTEVMAAATTTTGAAGQNAV